MPDVLLLHIQLQLMVVVREIMGLINFHQPFFACAEYE